MCGAYTHRAKLRYVSCWQRAWRNLILHFVNYKLFTPVICVWVSANDTFNNWLMCERVLRAGLSKQPHAKALLLMPSEVYRKITSTVPKLWERTSTARFRVFLEGWLLKMSPVEQQGLYKVDGAWPCGYTLQREPNTSETLTSRPPSSPNRKSQLEKARFIISY